MHTKNRTSALATAVVIAFAAGTLCNTAPALITLGALALSPSEIPVPVPVTPDARTLVQELVSRYIPMQIPFP